jgi:hypothetical protein
MSSPIKDLSNQSFNTSTDNENISFPNIILLNSCKDLSSIIKNKFLNKNENIKMPQVKASKKQNNIININNERIYNEILNDKSFHAELTELFNCLNKIIAHLESYSKKIIDEEKIKILSNLNIQLNIYLANSQNIKNNKYLTPCKSEINDDIIFEQIDKFLSLDNHNNNKEEQTSKDTFILFRDNHFDELSEIDEKDSEKESICEEEKEIIESIKGVENRKKANLPKSKEKNKIKNKTLLQHKIKRNKEIIDINEK